MNRKELLLATLLGLLLFGLYLTQRERLQAYDDCYMAHYEDWAGADCELGKGGE